ncbi:CPCC family cysteine-rich protein [Mesorhizobium opportunistum]|uniref:CPCC family cysteine-rich protein n=1 Tax=Mesorhizobium opportunistum TaxID=593909 RepID=UPI0033398016
MTGPLFPCPCCGSRVVREPGNYEICKECGWEDDPVQGADPDYAGGANELSLNQYRDRISN